MLSSEIAHVCLQTFSLGGAIGVVASYRPPERQTHACTRKAHYHASGRIVLVIAIRVTAIIIGIFAGVTAVRRTRPRGTTVRETDGGQDKILEDMGTLLPLPPSPFTSFFLLNNILGVTAPGEYHFARGLGQTHTCMRRSLPCRISWCCG